VGAHGEQGVGNLETREYFGFDNLKGGRRTLGQAQGKNLLDMAEFLPSTSNVKT
jgi:hypothetical protein